ncbi:hypothetical protein SK571_34740 [Lentzea sp. BCCO 10_0798]|uniref:Uncharacterized protein n=1 Tax=Lentzea kristufekii TaxID=3095430 RepID=A0ABU4U2J7_9PSEU|nr:hypothetical protein [Lentzea sp. BCCO 10_0798]MDX8054553.1 hypothetical protein [Lentzea sp. BCCO 10_0798]
MVKILVILRRTVDAGPGTDQSRHQGQNVDRVRIACQLWMTEHMATTITGVSVSSRTS